MEYPSSSSSPASFEASEVKDAPSAGSFENLHAREVQRAEGRWWQGGRGRVDDCSRGSSGIATCASYRLSGCRAVLCCGYRPSGMRAAVMEAARAVRRAAATGACAACDNSKLLALFWRRNPVFFCFQTIHADPGHPGREGRSYPLWQLEEKLDRVDRSSNQVVEVLHFMGGEIIPRRVLCPWRAHLLASTLPAVARATAACSVRCEWMIGRGIGFLRGSSSSWCVRCSSHGWPSVDSGLRAAATRFFPSPSTADRPDKATNPGELFFSAEERHGVPGSGDGRLDEATNFATTAAIRA